MNIKNTIPSSLSDIYSQVEDLKYVSHQERCSGLQEIGFTEESFTSVNGEVLEIEEDLIRKFRYPETGKVLVVNSHTNFVTFDGEYFHDDVIPITNIPPFLFHIKGFIVQNEQEFFFYNNHLGTTAFGLQRIKPYGSEEEGFSSLEAVVGAMAFYFDIEVSDTVRKITTDTIN